MQNRTNTIEERLQIINDYIQRTMDALNATRQVVQGLSAQQQSGPQAQPQGWVSGPVGLNHSSFVGYPQIVQTPYGFVQIPQQGPQFSQQGPQFSPYQQQLSPYGNMQPQYGLGHSPWAQQIPSWSLGQPQLGYGQQNFGPQMYGQQVGYPQQMGYGQQTVGQYGWQGGLNHGTWMPQHVAQQYGLPVQMQVPFQGYYGVNPQIQVQPQQPQQGQGGFPNAQMNSIPGQQI